MKTETISKLLNLLPENNGLYRNNPTVDPGFEWAPVLLSNAEQDPGFPWKYVQECVKLGMRLPLCVDSDPMRRAYVYLTTHVCDNDLMKAMALCADPYRNKRSLIEIALQDRDVSLDAIALEMCISRKCLDIFEGLFHSVRDRLDDQDFLNKLSFPYTRQAQFAKNYLQDTNPLVVARHFGRDGGVDSARQWMGGKPKDTTTAEKSTRVVQQAVCSKAAFLATAGCVNQPTYAVNKVMGQIAAEAMNSSAPKTQAIGSDLSEVRTLGDGINQSLFKRRVPTYMTEATTAGHARMLEHEKFFNTMKAAQKAE